MAALLRCPQQRPDVSAHHLQARFEALAGQHSRGDRLQEERQAQLQEAASHLAQLDAEYQAMLVQALPAHCLQPCGLTRAQPGCAAHAPWPAVALPSCKTLQKPPGQACSCAWCSASNPRRLRCQRPAEGLSCRTG